MRGSNINKNSHSNNSSGNAPPERCSLCMCCMQTGFKRPSAMLFFFVVVVVCFVHPTSLHCINLIFTIHCVFHYSLVFHHESTAAAKKFLYIPYHRNEQRKHASQTETERKTHSSSVCTI